MDARKQVRDPFHLTPQPQYDTRSFAGARRGGIVLALDSLSHRLGES